MKVGQSIIVRWACKLFAMPGRTAPTKAIRQVRTLDTEQLRQVGGGTSTPYKGW